MLALYAVSQGLEGGTMVKVLGDNVRSGFIVESLVSIACTRRVWLTPSLYCVGMKKSKPCLPVIPYALFTSERNTVVVLSSINVPSMDTRPFMEVEATSGSYAQP